MALVHPESDLTLSVFKLGADLLRDLQRHQNSMGVDHLLERHLREDRRRTIEGFFTALEMLFVVGAIDRIGYRIQRLVSTTDRDLFSQENGGA